MPKRLRDKVFPVAQVIGTLALLWALVPSNPYGYYILLRWVLCGIFIYLALQAHEQQKAGWVWVLGITAAVYNPILPLHATRGFWVMVNIATIILLGISAFVLRRRKTTLGGS